MKRAAIGAVVVLAGTAALVAVGAVGWAWWQSRLPGTYNVMDYAVIDDGGGPPAHAGHAGLGTVPVTRLRGPAGRPDARFTLTARHATVTLPSGRTVEALTFNGRVPGPELRAHRGDLVEVTLHNEDVEGGVTIHWHGVDVPNAEDGVAGVTQDAVRPGGSYTYRFRAEQVGTFWYHSHQDSDDEVRRGLYGPLVIEPATGSPTGDAEDVTVVVHTLAGIPLLNGSDGEQRRAVASGTPVRLRVVNSDNTPHRLVLAGTRFRVLAIDGTDLNEPGEIGEETLELAGGGRYDVGFTMPATPVGLSLEGGGPVLALSADGTADPPTATPTRDFDPASYGRPAATPFGVEQPLRSHVHPRGGAEARLLRRAPGHAVVDQRRDLPACADVRRVSGRPRPGVDLQRHERRASHAPARSPHARAEP